MQTDALQVIPRNDRQRTHINCNRRAGRTVGNSGSHIQIMQIPFNAVHEHIRLSDKLGVGYEQVSVLLRKAPNPSVSVMVQNSLPHAAAAVGSCRSYDYSRTAKSEVRCRNRHLPDYVNAIRDVPIRSVDQCEEGIRLRGSFFNPVNMRLSDTHCLQKYQI